MGKPAAEGSTFHFSQTYVPSTTTPPPFFTAPFMGSPPLFRADSQRCAFKSFVVTFGTRLGHGSSGAQMYSVASCQLLFSQVVVGHDWFLLLPRTPFATGQRH